MHLGPALPGGTVGIAWRDCPDCLPELPELPELPTLLAELSALPLVGLRALPGGTVGVAWREWRGRPPVPDTLRGYSMGA